MQDQNVAPFQRTNRMNQLQPASRMEPQPDATRRANHGSSAWSTPSRYPSLSQPQDGASDRPSRVILLQATLHTSLASEPEDARMTGGTRSLTRRVLGLNVTAEERKSAAPMKTLSPAAQVA